MVYLVTTVERVVETGTPVVVTDGNAVSSVTGFHPVGDLTDVVDWEVIRARMWANTDDDPDRRRLRQAELLAHSQVPLGAIDGLAVCSHAVRPRVEAVLEVSSTSLAIDVRNTWYFDS